MNIIQNEKIIETIDTIFKIDLFSTKTKLDEKLIKKKHQQYKITFQKEENCVHLEICGNNFIKKREFGGILGWDFLQNQNILTYQGHVIAIYNQSLNFLIDNQFIDKLNPLERPIHCFPIYYHLNKFIENSTIPNHVIYEKNTTSSNEDGKYFVGLIKHSKETLTIVKIVNNLYEFQNDKVDLNIYFKGNMYALKGVQCRINQQEMSVHYIPLVISLKQVCKLYCKSCKKFPKFKIISGRKQVYKLPFRISGKYTLEGEQIIIPIEEPVLKISPFIAEILDLKMDICYILLPKCIKLKNYSSNEWDNVFIPIRWTLHKNDKFPEFCHK